MCFFILYKGFDVLVDDINFKTKNLNIINEDIKNEEVIMLVTSSAYKITGLVVLMVGALFFLRDLGVNYIGNTSGWTIIIVLVGAALLAGDFELNKLKQKKK